VLEPLPLLFPSLPPCQLLNLQQLIVLGLPLNLPLLPQTVFLAVVLPPTGYPTPTLSLAALTTTATVTEQELASHTHMDIVHHTAVDQ